MFYPRMIRIKQHFNTPGISDTRCVTFNHKQEPPIELEGFHI